MPSSENAQLAYGVQYSTRYPLTVSTSTYGDHFSLRWSFQITMSTSAYDGHFSLLCALKLMVSTSAYDVHSSLRPDIANGLDTAYNHDTAFDRAQLMASKQLTARHSSRPRPSLRPKQGSKHGWENVWATSDLFSFSLDINSPLSLL
ncbi:hypothetical protein F511_11663 [Dorcoceras hygrometricum]|uniref:Uncharacterized protein n=1 Tax=Dorcoceras hygrometricum TaxID=472368 RepID=A0A2Z7A281_9LAMI|nr:hypothetical protein F511_11663 [Dorcoceras hygrometricum]